MARRIVGDKAVRLACCTAVIGLGASFLSACGAASAEVGLDPGNPPASAQLTVNPANMNFGDVAVGSSHSIDGTLTAGASDVKVSTASWNGQGFSLNEITFPKTIAAGQSATFKVVFSPQTEESVSGKLSFVTDAVNSPGTVLLSGRGIQTASRRVSLAWNASSTSVQGYFVYRGTEAGGPYTKISSLEQETLFTDSQVSEGTYHYVVTALGMNSVESGYSNEAVVTIP